MRTWLKAKGTTTIKLALLCLACFSLMSCAGGRTAGEHIADMPHWMGGLPADAPPRRGTPEYDEFMAKRAQEAARPKPEQQPKYFGALTALAWSLGLGACRSSSSADPSMRLAACSSK